MRVAGASIADGGAASPSRPRFATALETARALARARAPESRLVLTQGPVSAVEGRPSGHADAAAHGRRSRAEAVRPAIEADDGRRPDAVPVAVVLDHAAPHRSGEVSPNGQLVPPSAIERLVVAVGRQAQGTFLDLQLGADVQVRVSREPSGVAVVLSARTVSAARAEAELGGIVGALRSRGLAVTGARAVAGAMAPDGIGPGRGDGSRLTGRLR
jgi:hypothetical protein